MNEPKVIATYKRKTHGLTNEELAEAMVMYIEKLQKEICRDTIATFEQKHAYTMPDDLKGVVVFFMEKGIKSAFSEGMRLAEDTLLLVDNYKAEKSRTAESLTKQYEFAEVIGVSGVLFPDGTFHKCGNAEHYLLMTDIPMDVQTKCLYFSSTLRVTDDGQGLITTSPFSFSGITDAQRFWMQEHFKYFDRGQKRRAYFDWGIGEGM